MGINWGLQDFEWWVLPLKVRFLMKCHTEVRRGRRIIKTKQWKSRRHRRCIEQRSLFANSISNLYTKRLFQNIYQESVCCISVALCAVGTSVTLRYLRPLRDSVCLICKSFSLSLHISEEPLFYRHECQLCWKKPTHSHIHSYYSLAPTPLLFYCCTWYLPLQQAYQTISR